MFFEDTGDINEPAKIAAAAKVGKSADKPNKDESAGKDSPFGDSLPQQTSGQAESMTSQLPPPPPPETPQLQETAPDQDINDFLPADLMTTGSPPFKMNDVDNELETLTAVLTKLHERFYSKLDALTNDGESVQNRTSHGVDTKRILSTMKHAVFAGCVFVMSGVIPLGQVPERSEIWIFAVTFGAQCTTSVDSTTTHVIAAKVSDTSVIGGLM